jgi:hypothetical protein
MQAVLSGSGSVGLQARPAPAPHSPCMHGAQPARVVAAAASKGSGRPEDKVLLLGVTGITGRCVFQCAGAVGWFHVGLVGLQRTCSSAVLAVEMCTLVLAGCPLSLGVFISVISVQAAVVGQSEASTSFCWCAGTFCSATTHNCERSCIKHMQSTLSTFVVKHIAHVLTSCLQVCA